MRSAKTSAGITTTSSPVPGASSAVMKSPSAGVPSATNAPRRSIAVSGSTALAPAPNHASSVQPADVAAAPMPRTAAPASENLMIAARLRLRSSRSVVSRRA
ncbi:MAG: hypothetical protein NVV70_15950 [Cellulomonas sp.]|nr:hypothetical protein [Cellulomonas sp.]MCR6649546.1 hypothetical protein [Cellulomonas sp.]